MLLQRGWQTERNTVAVDVFEPHCFAGSKTGRHEVAPEGGEARMASPDVEGYCIFRV